MNIVYLEDVLSVISPTVNVRIILSTHTNFTQDCLEKHWAHTWLFSINSTHTMKMFVVDNVVVEHDGFDMLCTITLKNNNNSYTHRLEVTTNDISNNTMYNNIMKSIL